MNAVHVVLIYVFLEKELFWKTWYWGVFFASFQTKWFWLELAEKSQFLSSGKFQYCFFPKSGQTWKTEISHNLLSSAWKKKLWGNSNTYFLCDFNIKLYFLCYWFAPMSCSSKISWNHSPSMAPWTDSLSPGTTCMN